MTSVEHSNHPLDSGNFPETSVPLYDPQKRFFEILGSTTQFSDWDVSEIQQLMSHPGVLETIDAEGNNAWHIVMNKPPHGNKFLQILELFKQAGLDMNTENIHGETPLTVFFKTVRLSYGSSEAKALYDWLIQAGAELHRENREGLTPCHQLALRRCYSRASLLRHVCHNKLTEGQRLKLAEVCLSQMRLGDREYFKDLCCAVPKLPFNAALAGCGKSFSNDVEGVAWMRWLIMKGELSSQSCADWMAGQLYQNVSELFEMLCSFDFDVAKFERDNKTNPSHRLFMKTLSDHDLVAVKAPTRNESKKRRSNKKRHTIK